VNKDISILAWVLLIVLAMIWGSSFILIKRGLVVLSAGEVGSLRILSASLFLFPFAFFRLKRIKNKEWKYLFSVGLSGSLIPAFLFAAAQTRLPSSITGVLNALVPIFTILIGLFFYKVKQKSNVFVGIAIGFLGTTMLILARADNTISLNSYAFLVVLATIFYGINLNLIKYHLGGQSAISITSISLLLVGPISAVYLFLATDFLFKIQNVEGAILSSFYIVLLGVLGTAIALIIFNRLVQISTPVFTSSVTYIIPIVAVIWGLWDGEKLGFLHLIGMIGIIVGVYIANSSRLANQTRRIKTKKA